MATLGSVSFSSLSPELSPEVEIVSVGVDRSGSGCSQYADRLIVIGNDGEARTSATPLDFYILQEPISMDIAIGGTLDHYEHMLTSARIYASRNPHRSAILWRNNGGIFHHNSQIDSDYNYLSEYAYKINNVWIHGIADNRAKCFIPNVQAYGRHGQEFCNFCPTADELRYMVVSPIILGARGIQFYGLDLAMMSGNGDEGGSTAFTSPAELVNWGPSIDQENPNMISRVHQVVSELVNNDFTTALTALYCYAMGDDEVVHAYYYDGIISPISDNNCGFIALKDQNSGNIYVLLANMSNQPADASNVLWFKDEFWDNWSLCNVGGFPVTLYSGTDQVTERSESSPESRCLSVDTHMQNDRNSRSRIPLLVRYGDLPPYSSSIFYLTPRDEGSPNALDTQASEILDRTNLELRQDDGSIMIEMNIPGPYDNASLSMYDITGRSISTLWERMNGSEVFLSFSISESEYPAGVYFAVLQMNDHLISRKFTILR
ncbi:MAG: hypothetical protein GQ565_01945 [Candidatus Aegiribacteria sp.]|nr:hypothetical protein [Candidatus Aegiribacteria sp.]